MVLSLTPVIKAALSWDYGKITH